MSNQLLASKVVVIEEEPRVRSLPAIPTTVLGAVGITERGPIGVPTLVAGIRRKEETAEVPAPVARELTPVG